jgi:hypothetical protein
MALLLLLLLSCMAARAAASTGVKAVWWLTVRLRGG